MPLNDENFTLSNLNISEASWQVLIKFNFMCSITGGRERLHNVLRQIGSKLWRGARWLSGRVSDSGARGRGFETYRRRVVSFSKTLYSPKVLVNYPGSGGFIPT